MDLIGGLYLNEIEEKEERREKKKKITEDAICPTKSEQEEAKVPGRRVRSGLDVDPAEDHRDGVSIPGAGGAVQEQVVVGAEAAEPLPPGQLEGVQPVLREGVSAGEAGREGGAVRLRRPQPAAAADAGDR